MRCNVACAVFVASLLAWCEDLPDYPGKWKLAVNDTDYTEFSASPGVAKAFNSHLLRILEAVHAAPLFQTPRGITIDARVHPWYPQSCTYTRACATVPLIGRVELWLYWWLTNSDGKPVTDSELRTELWLTVNDLKLAGGRKNSATYEGLYDEHGREIVHQPRKTGEIGGFPVYDHSLMIFTRSHVPVWLPVSRETYLKAVMRSLEKEGAPPSVRESFGKQLQLMSPQQRASQAYYGPSDDPSNLVAADAQNASPLAIVNPALLHPARPRSDVQLIVAYFKWAAIGGTPDELEALDPTRDLGNVRLLEAVRTVDWKSVADLLAP
jgi:hypothetical protein